MFLKEGSLGGPEKGGIFIEEIRRLTNICKIYAYNRVSYSKISPRRVTFRKIEF